MVNKNHTMMTKIITTVIAYSATFLILKYIYSLASTDKTDKRAIWKVLGVHTVFSNQGSKWTHFEYEFKT